MGNRFWEFYLVRYLLGTIFAIVILFYLFYNYNNEISNSFFRSQESPQNAQATVSSFLFDTSYTLTEEKPNQIVQVMKSILEPIGIESHSIPNNDQALEINFEQSGISILTMIIIIVAGFFYMYLSSMLILVMHGLRSILFRFDKNSMNELEDKIKKNLVRLKKLFHFKKTYCKKNLVRLKKLFHFKKTYCKKNLVRLKKLFYFKKTYYKKNLVRLKKLFHFKKTYYKKNLRTLIFILLIIFIGSFLISNQLYKHFLSITTLMLAIYLFKLVYLENQKFYISLAEYRSEKTEIGEKEKKSRKKNSKIETNQNKEYIESYKHLREHGNAFGIIICEILLAAWLIFWNFSFWAVFYWCLMGFSSWILGTYLEVKAVEDYGKDKSV
ncbi:hypothetical protein [Paenibacillus sp. WLX2291]|uniref:hypothetical protein n=1 Tax=Paenibacillus sp. WLX2291 TaxID=3296934 RepID=UPI0039840FB0